MSVNEVELKVRELRELRRMSEELKAEMDSLVDSIKAYMKTHSVDTLSGIDWKITWKPVDCCRLDTNALRKALPEVADRFSKTDTSRRFLLV